jgi:hypothetical protein
VYSFDFFGSQVEQFEHGTVFAKRLEMSLPLPP